MRVQKRYTWGIALLIGLGLQARAGAADDHSNEPLLQPRRTDQGHLLAGWFNPSKTPKETQTAKQKPTQASVSPTQQSTKLRAREQDALLRRLDVCDQLRAVAARTGDDVLMRRADGLAERVWQIYEQRVEKLRSASSSKQTHDLQIETDTAGANGSKNSSVGDRQAGASTKETKP